MNINLVRKDGTTLDSSGNVTAERHLYRVTALPPAADPTAVIKDVFQTAPSYVDNVACVRNSARLKAVDQGLNPAMIEVEIEYSAPSGGGGGGGNEPNDNRVMISFSTAGGTRHITHAISQRRVFGETAAGTAINWNGRLGEESQIDGVDLPAAAVGFSLTKRFSSGKFTTAFHRTAMEMTGKVNRTSFRGWSAGEVLFSGMSYSGIEGEDIDVTFNFLVKPNEKAQIGKAKFSAEGWQYVWVLTQPGSGETPEVTDVYVATVCQYAEFSQLGV